ncbi:hypothetical protein Cme02nite_55860 [Catellatospora methionotrophica]|uniref:DUF4386 domain-containing protein n=1 Tax=Catellatospora methionotrophica TaxID=121620 RepID=A0A8J3PI13_9ACTN|nr:DUF4386 domain-containing protein [Catellatospora methionotrophica]GIG17254.1 hypothetical protein Cme02nite_55860 [Catellatospora methionotrophica]
MTDIKRTARITGLAYLGLAVTGLLGFLLIRQRLYVPGDATGTAANLTAHETLARLGVLADLGMVATQAVTAVWFWRLFRPTDPVAAGTLALFGLVNSVTILVGTMFTATALDIAQRADAASAAQALLLYELNGAAFTLGALFFGLWLMPMGWLAIRSGHLPRALGRLLIAGGVGYVLSLVVAVTLPEATGVVSALVLPATAGEFWMVGYLLVKGVSGRMAQPVAQVAAA